MSTECALVRQYTTSLSSLIIFIYSISLTILFYQKYKPLLRFQLIPLTINLITTLVMLILCVLEQIYSTNIVLLIIQIYSYSLFTYTYVSIYYRSNKNLEYSLKIQKLLNITMAIFTFLLILSVVSINILSAMEKITCYDQHGIATIILISILIPIYILTLVYINLTRKQFKNQLSSQYTQQHLLQQKDDQYIQMKLTQCNFIIFFFTISVLFHLAQICIFIIKNQEIKCTRNVLVVTNFLQMLILWLEDIGQILPHFAIPFILVLLPFYYNKKSKSVHFNNQYPNNITDSSSSGNNLFKSKENLIQGLQAQKKIRNRLKKQKKNSTN